jgi:hypothetical protein
MAYLLLAPGTAAAGGGGLSGLRDAILMAIDDIGSGRVHAGERTGSNG